LIFFSIAVPFTQFSKWFVVSGLVLGLTYRKKSSKLQAVCLQQSSANSAPP
jgi:hypothetical protein